MHRTDKMARAGQLRAQGLPLKVIAARLGISEGQASKLAKAAAKDSA
jgi:DNA-directed RNA polymerase specialized sigma subunit